MTRKQRSKPKNSETLPSVTAAPAKAKAAKGPMNYLGYFTLGNSLNRIEVLVYQNCKGEIRFLSSHKQWMKNFPNWAIARNEIPLGIEMHIRVDQIH